MSDHIPAILQAMKAAPMQSPRRDGADQSVVMQMLSAVQANQHDLSEHVVECTERGAQICQTLLGIRGTLDKLEVGQARLWRVALWGGGTLCLMILFGVGPLFRALLSYYGVHIEFTP